jgi:predicted nucleic acid-binding Zn ribbon protein
MASVCLTCLKEIPSDRLYCDECLKDKYSQEFLNKEKEMKNG